MMAFLLFFSTSYHAYQITRAHYPTQSGTRMDEQNTSDEGYDYKGSQEVG